MSRQRLVLQPQQIAQIQDLILDPSSYHDLPKFNLTLEQQNYLYKVLRLKSGAEFIALDGRGIWWRAVLAEVGGQFQILEQIPIQPQLQVDITLAIAMPKGNGMEAVIRQATELGVGKILPLWSDRTVIRPNTSIGASKLERWLKIAQEMSEQSHRTYVPKILAPQTFGEAIQFFTPNGDDSCSKYICVTPKHTPHLLNLLLGLNQLPAQVVLFTGAEGGWTEAETALAIAHNFQPVSLGDRILAAITAPVVALSIITAVIESNQC